MTQQEFKQSELHSMKEKLERAGTIHWFHWMIVFTSFTLTVTAWFFSTKQLEEKNEIRFEQQASQIKELLIDRLKNYEDSLWGGVAVIQSNGGKIDYETWKRFASSLKIENKYPGINGIGVIHEVKKHELDSYLLDQRNQRPHYNIYPAHDEPEYMPISYIIPEKGNEKAVGLDIAHEKNRYHAAKRARTTGLASITGPITLVQDQGKTPGFLFFAPFYFPGIRMESSEDREAAFAGMVYAPFVVNRLIDGVLSVENRQVGFSITDGDFVLYDEHKAENKDVDPQPQYKKIETLEIYGRQWTLDIRPTLSFRKSTASSQPKTILFGGIVIDTLLLTLFILMSRSSRIAISYAEKATFELKSKADELEKANIAKNQFLANMSHELRTPLNAIIGFSSLVKDDLKEGMSDSKNHIDYLNRVNESGHHLLMLINDILDISKMESGKFSLNIAPVNFMRFLNSIEESGAILALRNNNQFKIQCHVQRDEIISDETRLRQIILNLISNAAKFTKNGKIELIVNIEGRNLKMEVHDTGIGISASDLEEIFEKFTQLREATKDSLKGTGLGLPISRELAKAMSGSLTVKSQLNVGSTFTLLIPIDLSFLSNHKEEMSHQNFMAKGA